jgi:predicted kinase
VKKTPRAPAVRISDAAIHGQTQSLLAHRQALVAQLRQEIGVGAAPTGRAALVMLMGLPGVGKSHCARLLATALGATHVASDHLRSRLFIAASYTESENAAVFAIAEALVDELLGEGQVVVLDATNLVARNRAPAENVARRRGASLFHVLVTADEADTRARLASRAGGRAADDHSDADVRVYERMRAREFEPPAGGHLVIRNGPALADDIARVADVVRDRS